MTQALQSTPETTDVDGSSVDRLADHDDAHLVTLDVRAAVRRVFERNRSAMTVEIARKLAVPEVEVIRALPDDLSTELDPARWESLIRSFDALGDVHVICTSGACTLETTGTFGGFSLAGPYFNVQHPSLDMHIRWKNLAAIFALEKPGHMDGVSTLSFQFFDGDGRAAFKAFLSFGGKPATPERKALFERIRDEHRLA